MKYLRFCNLLLVMVISSQARAQTDSLMVEEEGIEEGSGIVQETGEWDDHPLQVQVKGFLDTYHAVRAEGPNDWMSSRTRARGEVTVEKGPASLFVSLNATYNGLLKDRTGIELREAYLSWTKDNLDFRVGRQIVVWGVADALRVTDCVSPFDYTEFLAQDYDDIRMPENLIRAKYTLNAVTIETVCCPVADFFLLPVDEKNPWSVSLPEAPLPYLIDLESGKPDKRFCNLEFGGRLGFNLSGIDFSVSALRTWNKMPVMSMNLSDDQRTICINGEYHRMTMLGGDCSLPVGKCVLRGEFACYLGEAQGAVMGKQVERRDAFSTLAGVDWYPGKDWNVSMQYCHKYISGALDGLSVFRNSGLATVRISKELFQNMLKLSTFGYIDVTNGGVFNRLSASYSLNDQIEITAGYDFFHADRGQFVMYARNSEVWMKMKYSF